MSLLPDNRLKSIPDLMQPFTPVLVRESFRGKEISHGLSSYGYDISLAADEFKILKLNPLERLYNALIRSFQPDYATIDPKRYSGDYYQEIALNRGENGDLFFVMPAYSYGLGFSVEKFSIPANVTGVALGKSTYARVGIVCNITPLEAGWKGHLTLEFANPTPYPVRIYANEGVAQILFFEGEPCDISYSDRGGKYQSQPAKIVHGKV